MLRRPLGDDVRLTPGTEILYRLLGFLFNLCCALIRRGVPESNERS